MLSSKTKAIIGIIIAAWLVLLLGLIAWNTNRPQPVVQGSLSGTLSEMEDMSMRSAGVMPIDVWGDEIVATIPVCPGVTPDQIEQGLGVDPNLFTYSNGAIPESTNYMVMMDAAGESHTEKLLRTDVDLCANPQLLRAYQGPELMFFLKNPENDVWTLVG